MTIRPATPADAQQLITHVHHVSNEPNRMVVLGPGEFQLTVEQEEKLLADYAKADNSIYLVVEVEDRIVGTLICTGGKRAANRHAAAFSISLRREWRGQGLGTQLMTHFLQWAQGTGVLKRIELEVFAHNEPAIGLYRKFGFMEEGRRRRAYIQDGRDIDGILMALLW